MQADDDKPEQVACARVGCGKQFPPHRAGTSTPKRFCCQQCRTLFKKVDAIEINKARERQRRYRKKHKDLLVEKAKEYYEENSERIRGRAKERSRRCREQNPEHYKIRIREYRKRYKARRATNAVKASTKEIASSKRCSAKYYAKLQQNKKQAAIFAIAKLADSPNSSGVKNVNHQCRRPECSGEFYPTRSNHVFCCHECAVKYHGKTVEHKERVKAYAVSHREQLAAAERAYREKNRVVLPAKIKRCVYCQGEFASRGGGATEKKFCSADCRIKHINASDRAIATRKAYCIRRKLKKNGQEEK